MLLLEWEGASFYLLEILRVMDLVAVKLFFLVEAGLAFRKKMVLVVM